MNQNTIEIKLAEAIFFAEQYARYKTVAEDTDNVFEAKMVTQKKETALAAFNVRIDDLFLSAEVDNGEDRGEEYDYYVKELVRLEMTITRLRRKSGEAKDFEEVCFYKFEKEACENEIESIKNNIVNMLKGEDDED